MSQISKEVKSAVAEVPLYSNKRAHRAALSSFMGAVVDWYDFLLYGIVAALVFNHQFFPNISPAMGTLAAFATFGIGFLFRPLGGVVFGHFGDRIGRKKMLVLTVFLMGGSTVLIGLLPNFEAIGWAAPVLLVVLRAIQGFAVGGEWGGAALMAVESAPPGKKAFYSSGVQVGYGVGLMLATGSVSLIIYFFGNEAFHQWAWRIPFVASVVLLLVALWIRRNQQESTEFEQTVVNAKQQVRRMPIIEAVTRHPKAFLYIIALRFAELLTMYLVTNFALNYSTVHLGMSSSVFLNIGLLVGAVSCVSIPLFAKIADHYGYRRMCVGGGIIGALSAVPFFLAMEQGNLFLIYLFAILLANIAHDMVVSVHQPLFTEFFGTAYRYSGAGVGYQVASIVGGGFTPFIAAALVAWYDGAWYPVAVYLMVGCLLTALAAATMQRK
ncbi:MFS transporter, MHS family, shikimate and dehydroshikimate transport protein [Pasteurella testudinis DSM 23072]|uniref:MFS transporter, MHS family, shikimate and dehydroshikimate transport protein n=1 Tax=Pasteurella testudinis DSM 23072 TaxID=1122938 RepID=A0A1W1V2L2_9PAST|nr:shikimate transporter [Pasteurella testudinis]SMB87617.1 MFS transporter, MHS family, shikimate and dehydroshikimate transport protein [Pasteurella testudinis DSM 23072]SUB50492.1 putative metabolite transport protein [Pasteurella testudinis]